MSIDPYINYDSITVPSPFDVESGILSAAGATPWLLLRQFNKLDREMTFTADIDQVSSPVGTFIVEARMAHDDGSKGAIETIFSSSTLTDFPEVGRISGRYEVRMRCSVYTSGSYNLRVAR